MNILSTGGGTGLGHTLASFNYAVKMSEFFIERGVDISLYFKWRNHDSFLNLYDVNLKFFKSEDPEMFINNADSYRHDPKSEIEWVNLQSHNNIILDARSTSPPDYDFLFKTISLKPHISKQLLDIIKNELDCGDYTVIHVRGGDQIKNKYNSNFEDFFETNCKRIDDIILKTNNKILLCTDNQDLVKKYVDNKTVFSKSLVYELYKENVHVDSSYSIHSRLVNEQPHLTYRSNLSAVIDLYLLIFCKTLYADSPNSGYAQLATRLNRIFLKNNVSADTLFDTQKLV